MSDHPVTKTNPFPLFVLTTTLAVAGLYGLFRGIALLHAGVLTYTKRGYPTRTVSPISGAFEFYYEVAHLLTLAFFGLLGAILIGRASHIVITNKPPTPAPQLLGVPFFLFAIAWIALHLLRYWLL